MTIHKHLIVIISMKDQITFRTELWYGFLLTLNLMSITTSFIPILNYADFFLSKINLFLFQFTLV